MARVSSSPAGARRSGRRCEFARCVRERGQPEVGGEVATANVAVLEAIVESIETGRAARVGS